MNIVKKILVMKEAKVFNNSKYFYDLSKIKAETIKGLDPHLKCIFIDIVDTNNFELLTKVVNFENCETIIIDDTILLHTKRQIEVKWAHKAKYKSIGEAD